MIYLDHNATTPILPEAADAIREASLSYGANPGSQHEAGRRARRALEDARERIGELLGARQGGMEDDRVVITSGGTEANHLALLGMLQAQAIRRDGGPPGHLILSHIEHPCVAEPAEQLRLDGWQVDRVPVSSSGVVQLDRLVDLITAETRLVCLMHANNETGVVQPVAEAARICCDRGVALHTDAAQTVGKIPVNFSQLGVTALTCAAHKFHGPVGIGALIVRHGVPLDPTMWGGHQQGGLRAGTEMVALTIGMRTALEHWKRESQQQRERIASLRDLLEQRIVAGYPEAMVLGRDAERLPNTSNIAFAGLDRQALVMALDLAGVACSTGSACASGSSEPSPVLVAMGVERRAISGSLRFSLGVSNTAPEIEEAARRILSACKQLGQSSNH